LGAMICLLGVVFWLGIEVDESSLESPRDSGP
jgi:hypothetical protein